MPRVGFEPTISAGERPKTYALDRAGTGIGYLSPAINEKAYNNPAGFFIINPQSIGLAVRVCRYTNLLGDRRGWNSKEEIEYNKANSAPLLQ